MADEPVIATSIIELPVDEDPPPDGDDAQAAEDRGEPVELAQVPR